MPDGWPNIHTSDAIREAAAMLFERNGYEATTLRQVATEVGITVGSLYNHMSSKEDLLGEILGGVLDDLLVAHERATAGISDPLERLRAAVEVHIRFHATHAREVFIGNTEQRSLTPARRGDVVAKRGRYETELQRILADAAKAGAADPVDLRLQVYAIVAIGAHVASWYRPDGAFSLKRVVECYTQIILRQLGAA